MRRRLTPPLQLADANFRRQILVQMLILFQYLLSLTPAERTRVSSFHPFNTATLSPYVLQAENETWIREMRSRTLDELDSMEGGRRFRKSVQLVLQREQNWVRTKRLHTFAPLVLTRFVADGLETPVLRALHQALARRRRRVGEGSRQASRCDSQNEKVPLQDGKPEPQPDVAAQHDNLGWLPAECCVRCGLIALIVAILTQSSDQG